MNGRKGGHMRKVWRFAWVLGALFLLSFPGIAPATSLWQDGSNLFGDERPSRVGDIVTVVVDENTKVTDEATTEIKKDNSTSGSNPDGGWGFLNFLNKLGFTSNVNMTGEGTTERKHKVSSRVSCLVTEVLPNGNLVVEGTRDLQTHKETLTVVFRGVIRPRDVKPDNTIDSTLVANAELGIQGKGALSRVQQPGLLTQIFQAIF
jgi:flagellar L-ring protein precursor FlgH